MKKARILFYYKTLRNTDQALAGTSTAMLLATARLAAVCKHFDLVLAGDDVLREEDFPDGRRLIPLPGPDNLKKFLRGFDVVVMASHVAAFLEEPKPYGQRWVLLQHCWDLMEDLLPRIQDFDVTIALSVQHRDHLATQGLPPQRIEVITNQIDTELFHPAVLPQSPMRLLYAGALVPHKGVHVLVAAMPLLLAVEPEASLDVIGSETMWQDYEAGYAQRLRRDAAGLPIRFFEPLAQPALAEQYRTHGICCLPSRLESFGLVLVEAQACGCVPVAHCSGGVAAVIRHGETGLLYSPNTPKILAETLVAAIRRLRRGEPLRERAIASARSRFDGHEQTLALAELLNGQAGLEDKC